MRKISLAILFLFILFSGCISDDENSQVIFERDKQKIEEYLEQNPITSVKEFVDPALGIRVFWIEASESGKQAAFGDTVTVDYTGKLLTNSVFDTSIESVARQNNIFFPGETYEPLEFLLGAGFLLPGFEFVVSLMEEGDKVISLIPSLYGYGAVETQGIPRNSPLIFEIDLINIREEEEEE